MSQAKNGDTVKVHYKGTFDDGFVFDSSEGREPLAFTVGEGQVIPGFEQAIDGMVIGDSKNVRIPAHEAYGPRREEMIQTIERAQIPPDLDLSVGQQLQVQGDGGHTFVVTITELTDDSVTLDANHPMAGKDLNFEIELVEIG